MKKYLPFIILLLTSGFVSSLQAQTELAANQNPNYEVSRSKYMKLADSINTWHSTTAQETYKAIDYMADRKEARDERRAFRRQLRLERNTWYGDYYYPTYGNRWLYPQYNNWGRRNWRNNSFYINPWGLGYWWR
ncbi:MAG: hypothetical protein GXC78_15395 [Chitinophagaceae bacterium]|jgi:ABC-type branched-subunit amino acid transport system substrate-binding protein|nr:hypothetical protein [Chitinophagaceae bacterium]